MWPGARPLPSRQVKGWAEYFDPKHQSFYYVHIVTNTTTWTQPAEFRSEHRLRVLHDLRQDAIGSSGRVKLTADALADFNYRPRPFTGVDERFFVDSQGPAVPRHSAERGPADERVAQPHLRPNTVGAPRAQKQQKQDRDRGGNEYYSLDAHEYLAGYGAQDGRGGNGRGDGGGGGGGSGANFGISRQTRKAPGRRTLDPMLQPLPGRRDARNPSPEGGGGEGIEGRDVDTFTRYGSHVPTSPLEAPGFFLRSGPNGMSLSDCAGCSQLEQTQQGLRHTLRQAQRDIEVSPGVGVRCG